MKAHDYIPNQSLHFTESELNEFLLFVERIEEKFVSYLWKRCDTFADLVLH